MMSAELFIARTSSIPDWLRSYRVMLDGKLVGTLRLTEMMRIPISEGSHSLCVRVDWCGSRAVSFDAKEKEEVHFECGSALANWRMLFALYYVVFGRNDYLW